MDFLNDTYYRLLKALPKTKRYLFDTFEMHRLTGLIGPRGVGKTTLMLQYIKEKIGDPTKAFYFAADNIYFTKVSIIEFVNKKHQEENINSFFIDEVHKYHNWEQELKTFMTLSLQLKLSTLAVQVLKLHKAHMTYHAEQKCITCMVFRFVSI